jgi:hypothetical protein
MRLAPFLALIFIVWFGAVPASSQVTVDGDPWVGIVSASGGVQVDTKRLSQSFELTKNFEPAPITAELSDSSVPFFDAGATFRIAGDFGAGVAVSFLSNTDDATVEASVAHPFYFDRDRTISGTVGVVHRETAVHTNAAYLLGTDRLTLLLFGGASFFKLEQDLVTDVEYDETYPYDTATFAEATLVSVSESKVGYNVGADVTWRLSPRWGIGGLLRYSHASIPLEAAGLDFGSVDVGGLMAGGGIRIMF